MYKQVNNLNEWKFANIVVCLSINVMFCVCGSILCIWFYSSSIFWRIIHFSNCKRTIFCLFPFHVDRIDIVANICGNQTFQNENLRMHCKLLFQQKKQTTLWVHILAFQSSYLIQSIKQVILFSKDKVVPANDAFHFQFVWYQTTLYWGLYCSIWFSISIELYWNGFLSMSVKKRSYRLLVFKLISSLNIKWGND